MRPSRSSSLNIKDHTQMKHCIKMSQKTNFQRDLVTPFAAHNEEDH